MGDEIKCEKCGTICKCERRGWYCNTCQEYLKFEWANPCPFCGGKSSPEFFSISISGTEIINIYIQCEKCRTRGPYFDATKNKIEAEKQAIKAWNHREV